MNRLNRRNINLVTIAIPVFNGGEYLKEAIESVINQDYKDLEILISDNASSDDTEEICRNYSQIDNRIKYIRQKKNIGAINNFIFLLEKANGKFFSWCASDDKFLSKNLISKSVSVIKENNCSACIPEINLIDHNSAIKYNLLKDFTPGISSKLSRLFSIIKNNHTIYSLYEIDILRKYIGLLEKHQNLECFNEGLFMIAMFTNINSYYDKSISRAYRTHNNNLSRKKRILDLIGSYLIFVTDSLRYIYLNEKLKFYQKICLFNFILFRAFYYITYLSLSLLYRNSFKKFLKIIKSKKKYIIFSSLFIFQKL